MPRFIDLARIAAIVLLLVLCTLLPYSPGRYDPLAAPLSWMARLFVATAALLVTPIGIVWLIASRGRPRPLGFAIAALVGLSIAWSLMSLAAITESGFTLGLVVIATGIWTVWRLATRLRVLNRSSPIAPTATPIYMIAAPILAAALQLLLLPPAIEFSRNRAMQNCSRLIADIERFRVEHGVYPPSLPANLNDYPLSIVGIREYRYEPAGEAYNLCFENVAYAFGNREIVVYNPQKNEATATTHDWDILNRPLEQQVRMRGFHASFDAGPPGWKYFWFD